MKHTSWLVPFLIALIIGGAAFFGGMQFQKSRTTAAISEFAQSGQGVRGQGRLMKQGGRGVVGRNGNFTLGKVISQDNTSVTLQLPDGSSKIVNLTSSTTYSKTDAATKTDLKTGDMIATVGTTNTDGSITAQNIQLNPQLRNGIGRMSGETTVPSPVK